MGKSKKKKQNDVMVEKQRAISASDITGISIWHEIKNRQLERVVYSNRFMNDGYIITDDDARKFSLYQSRTIVAEVLFVFIYIITRKLLISFAIPAIFYVIVSALFFKKYLPTLEHIDNYEKPVDQKAKPEYAAGKLQFYIAVLASGALVIVALIAYVIKSANVKDALLSCIVFLIIAIAMVIYGIVMMNNVKKARKAK